MKMEQEEEVETGDTFSLGGERCPFSSPFSSLLVMTAALLTKYPAWFPGGRLFQSGEEDSSFRPDITCHVSLEIFHT